MKRLALLLLVAADAAAQCRPIEFAELSSFSRETLLGMRCEYHDAMFKATLAEIANAGDPRRSAAASAISNKCHDEVDRMDRLIARKYSLPAGDATTLAQRINTMCESKKGRR